MRSPVIQNDRSPMAGDIRREGGGRSWMALVYLGMHLAPLTLFWTGLTLLEGTIWLLVCLVLLNVRGLCMSAGYHRYFGHRSFKMSRWLQFLCAMAGGTALRGGPLWWASLHRHHHRFADLPEDVHSPDKGFWWSYGGWLISSRYDFTRYDLVSDLAKYPELCWLNRYWLAPPLLLGLVMLLAGGWAGFALGFCLSSAIPARWAAASIQPCAAASMTGCGRICAANRSLKPITAGNGWNPASSVE